MQFFFAMLGSVDPGQHCHWDEVPGLVDPWCFLMNLDVYLWTTCIVVLGRAGSDLPPSFALNLKTTTSKHLLIMILLSVWKKIFFFIVFYLSCVSLSPSALPPGCIQNYRFFKNLQIWILVFVIARLGHTQYTRLQSESTALLGFVWHNTNNKEMSPIPGYWSEASLGLVSPPPWRCIYL